MKLFYAKGTCSLADHIALHEAGLAFERESVDLRTKKTESGADFDAINPKSYVPALVLDSGELLTENIAILDWITHQSTALKPAGELGHSRLIEALGYISTEIHQQFGAFFTGGSDEAKNQAKEAIQSRVALLAKGMKGEFLLGSKVSAADFYFFVMLLWSVKRKFDVPEQLTAYMNRLRQLPSVQKAMKEEGMI